MELKAKWCKMDTQSPPQWTARPSLEKRSSTKDPRWGRLLWMSKSYQSYPCMGEIVRIVTVAKVSIITSPDVAIIFPNQIEKKCLRSLFKGFDGSPKVIYVVHSFYCSIFYTLKTAQNQWNPHKTWFFKSIVPSSWGILWVANSPVTPRCS